MIVAKEQRDGLSILRVEGVIKLGQSAKFFAEALKKALAEEEGHVVVDMAEINYMDSTGIGELVGYLVKLQEAKRKLILAGPNDRVLKLLRVVGVDELFPIYRDLDAAIAAEQPDTPE